MPDKKVSAMTAYPNSTFGANDIFYTGYYSGGIYYPRKLTGTQILATISSGITIGTTAITSGTTKRVLFQDGSVVSQSANFVFDAANQLVIGGHTGGAKIDVKAGGALSTDLLHREQNSAGTINFKESRGDGTYTRKDSAGTTRINLTTTDSYFLYNGNNFIQFGSENRIYSAANFALTTAATTNRVLISVGSTYNFSFYKGTFQCNTILQDTGTATNAQIFENGVAPSGALTNHYYQYSADESAGNACPHFRTENQAVIKLFKGAAIADATDAASAITQLNLLLARMRVTGGNGLIAD
jgi:hypothetical protein